MAKMKKIGILFSAKLIATMAAGLGLIAGILYSFGGFFYELSINNLNTGTALAFFALIGMPLIFSACGFIGGAIGAVLYNIAAKRFGGIEMDFKTDS